MGNEDSIISSLQPGRDDPLTYAIIGAAMKSHSELGPGLDERLYHDLMAARLRSGGVEVESKPHGSLVHRGIVADALECDLLLPGERVAELKVLPGPETFAPEHFAQIISYLKFWRIETGLLLDFGKERLIYRRVVYTEQKPAILDTSKIVEQVSGLSPHREIAHGVCERIVRICREYGLGYRDTTYRGLIAADLKSDRISFVSDPVISIRIGENDLGNTCCNCFVVENEIALLVLALRKQITTSDRAILQTYLKHLGLPYGLVANFGKRSLDLAWVGRPKSSQFNNL